MARIGQCRSIANNVNGGKHRDWHRCFCGITSPVGRSLDGGSNNWRNYLDVDLDITRIFDRALTAGASCRVVFGTDSSFFPRGFRYNILEEQYYAVKSLLPKFNYTQEDIDLIFKDNILRLTGFKPRTTL